MTTTNAITGQSIGTGANATTAGDIPLFPQKVTIATTTTAFVVTGKITNGAGAYDKVKRTRIWYSSSSFNFAATAALVAQLRGTARFVELNQSGNAGEVRITDSSLEPVTGGFIYLWVEVPNHTVAQTLDVNVVELP